MEPTRIRYQLDEHVAHAIAHGLARRATDVATAIDSGVVGLPDDQLLARWLTEGRVLITHDQDFLRLHRQGVAHAGIVFCEQRSRSIGEIVAYLSLVTDVLSPAEIAARVEFV